MWLTIRRKFLVYSNFSNVFSWLCSVASDLIISFYSTSVPIWLYYSFMHSFRLDCRVTIICWHFTSMSRQRIPENPSMDLQSPLVNLTELSLMSHEWGFERNNAILNTFLRAILHCLFLCLGNRLNVNLSNYVPSKSTAQLKLFRYTINILRDMALKSL